MKIKFPDDIKIYIACGKTDMRKAIDGLSLIVSQNFNLDPFENALFLFCSGKKDRMKALYSDNSRQVAQAEKEVERISKQLKEVKDYDEKIGHLALSRIGIDLDDGVKANYEKVQTDEKGKKLEILAKI